MDLQVKKIWDDSFERWGPHTALHTLMVKYVLNPMITRRTVRSTFFQFILYYQPCNTAQKMTFSIEDFVSKWKI